MYLLLYNIFLLLFRSGIRVVAWFNPKARLWLAGRKNIFQKLEEDFRGRKKTIWFHCASLGEFEQGRPVLEKMKSIYPQYEVLVTFFSPSGYEVRKNYKPADHIFYLPLDSSWGAARFLDIVNPSLVVFVKYEFWHYYYKEIGERKIPFLLISAVFRKNQVFFKWYGSLYRSMLYNLTHIFVQDNYSKELLKTLGFEKNVSVAGDTRFDRVVEIAGRFEPIPFIGQFGNGAKIMVAGSTWPGDEKVLHTVFSSERLGSLKLIIAPHETGKDHLDQLKVQFPGAIFYSDLGKPDPLVISGSSILIIDSIGLLSRLYHYAYIAYIGGGFTRDGIHNILEAAVYGKPVVYGPVYKKYREALELIEAGGASSFSTPEALNQLLVMLLDNPGIYARQCEASKKYVQVNEGATTMILQFIQENRLLIS